VAPRHWCCVCALLDYTFDLVFRAIPGKVVPSHNTNSTRHPEFLSSSPRTTKSQCYDVLYECNTQSQRCASRSTPAPHFSKRLTDWTHRLNGLFKISRVLTMARQLRERSKTLQPWPLAWSGVQRLTWHGVLGHRRCWHGWTYPRRQCCSRYPRVSKRVLKCFCRDCPGSFFGL